MEKSTKGLHKVIKGVITDPETGEQRTTYCRIPIALRPRALAENYAKVRAKSLYGEGELTPAEEEAVQRVIREDFWQGYLLGVYRAGLHLTQGVSLDRDWVAGEGAGEIADST